MRKSARAIGAAAVLAMGVIVPHATHAAGATTGEAIAQTALKYVGYPFSTHGHNPAEGFNVVGLVGYAYRQNGINLPFSFERALRKGPRVARADLQPGDIVYFKNTVRAGLSHDGIYIGNGEFVHAEWYTVGVRVSSFVNDPVDGNYWSVHYLTANRPWGGS